MEMSNLTADTQCSPDLAAGCYDRRAIVTGDFRLSDDLPRLLQATRAFLPATGLGVLTREGDAHAVLRWATTYGVHAHRVAIDDLPAALQPPWSNARVMTTPELEADSGNKVVER